MEDTRQTTETTRTDAESRGASGSESEVGEYYLTIGTHERTYRVFLRKRGSDVIFVSAKGFLLGTAVRDEAKKLSEAWGLAVE